MKLEGTNVVVTGAASGIGRELVRQLASSSMNVKAVWAVDVNADLLSRAYNSNDDNSEDPVVITPYVCDVSDQDSVNKLFQDAEQRLGRIDLFIANAGFAYYERIQDRVPDWDHTEKIYRVNVFSPIYAFEKMQQMHHHHRQDKGGVGVGVAGSSTPHKTVITASVMAHMGVPGYAIYASTKAALDRFAETHRYWEMGDPKELMLVYPIATNKTNFYNNTSCRRVTPQPWPTQTPEAVARATIRGIQRDKQSVYPSKLFNIVLLLKRVLPIHRIAFYREYLKFRKWAGEDHQETQTPPHPANVSARTTSETRKQQ